jgi:WD40 repeat protein
VAGGTGLTLWRVLPHAGTNETAFPQLKRVKPVFEGKEVRDVCFSPQGDRLAWIDLSIGKIHLWDLAKGHSCPAPDERMAHSQTRISFWRDGDHLLYIGQKDVPKHWNVVTQQTTPCVDGTFSGVGKIAVSSDGNWLARFAPQRTSRSSIWIRSASLARCQPKAA